MAGKILKKYRWLLFLLGAGILLYLTVSLLRDRPPSWVEWQEKTESLRAAGESHAEDRTALTKGTGENAQTSSVTLEFTLRNRKLTAAAKGKILWSTDPKWQVQDFLTADLDGDEKEELILLLWKKGRYGEHRPFWVKEDEKTYSQHIFLYDVTQEGELHPKWFASNLGREVTHMDLISAGVNVLALEDREDTVTCWIWQSWGLKQIEQDGKNLRSH